MPRKPAGQHPNIVKTQQDIGFFNNAYEYFNPKNVRTWLNLLVVYREFSTHLSSDLRHFVIILRNLLKKLLATKEIGRSEALSFSSTLNLDEKSFPVSEYLDFSKDLWLGKILLPLYDNEEKEQLPKKILSSSCSVPGKRKEYTEHLRAIVSTLQNMLLVADLFQKVEYTISESELKTLTQAQLFKKVLKTLGHIRFGYLSAFGSVDDKEYGVEPDGIHTTNIGNLVRDFNESDGIVIKIRNMCRYDSSLKSNSLNLTDGFSDYISRDRSFPSFVGSVMEDFLSIGSLHRDYVKQFQDKLIGGL
jgi:hypothetical protein